MKKLLGRICLFTLICSNIFAQKVKVFNDQLLSYDTSIYFNLPEDKISKICFDGDSTVIYSSNEKDTVLKFMNIYNGQVYYETSVGKYIDWVSHIYADTNYLIITTDDDIMDVNADIYIFSRENDGLKFLQTIQLDSVYAIEEAYALNNRYLLLVDNQRCATWQTQYNNILNLILFDLTTFKEVKRVSPYIHVPLMTGFSPNKLVCVSDSSILFAQKGVYKIYEYDFNLNLIDSFSNENLKWKAYPTDKHDSIIHKYSAMADMLGMMVNDAIKCSYTLQIYNKDNLLLVTYNDPYNKTVNGYASYDVWKKSNNKWELIINNAPDNVQKKFRKKRQYSRLRGGLSYRFSFVKDDRLFILNDGIPVPLNKITKMSNKEFKKFETQYYLKNSDKAILDVFKINYDNIKQ